MRDDDRSLLPLQPSSIARVGAPSRLITRGMERLQQAARRIHELPTPAGAISRAHAINNRGQIVGLVHWPDDSTQAVLWEHGQMIMLETHAGMHSRAFDINDHGQVVGVEYLADYGGDVDGGLAESTAVLWQDGEIIYLEYDGRLDSQANAVNNKGQIVGTRGTDAIDGHVNAVLWYKGHRTILETPVLGPNDAAFGVNDHGVIVGTSHSRAVVWASGKVSGINLPGRSYPTWESDAQGINEHGQIVGTVWPNPYEPPDWNGPPQCILWQEGRVSDLGPTHASMDAPHPRRNFPKLAINNFGQVVGLQSSTCPNVAWMWDGSRMIELANPTSAFTCASDINDHGSVVGSCDYGDGVWRACLWE